MRDSLPRLWWQPDFAQRALGDWMRETLADRDALRHTGCASLAEVLARETRVALFEAGSSGAWDQPYFLGPGLERLTLWHNESKTTGAAIPTPPLQTATPLEIGTLRYLPPDPLIDPLAAAGDGMLVSQSPELAYRSVPSAFRFVEGPYGASHEGAYLARETGPTRFLLNYGHASSRGRQIYGPSRSQNLALQIERATPYGALYVSGADRDGRIKVYDGGKRYWEARELTVGAQVIAWPRVQTQVRLVRRNDSFHDYNEDGWGRRRSTSTELNAHGRFQLGRLRLAAGGAVERIRLSTGGSLLENFSRHETGTGLATGFEWRDPRVRVSGSWGYADPWWYRGHARGRVAAEVPLGWGWALTLQGWRTAAPIFVPRLESDGEAALSEGLGLGGEEIELGDCARMLQHAQGGLRFDHGRLRLQVGLFARTIEDGLGFDPETAALFAQATRTPAALDSAMGDVTLLGALGGGELDLGYGVRLFGDLTLIGDPREEDLPLLTPAYHGRGGVALRGILFKGDLHWRLRFIGRLQGSMLTPYGRIPAWSRLDGELHLTHRSASLFLQVRNIEDDEALAATYENAWMRLPIRSVWTGLEWHFDD